MNELAQAISYSIDDYEEQMDIELTQEQRQKMMEAIYPKVSALMNQLIIEQFKTI